MSKNGAVQPILVTGAIGDHGTATSMTKAGKVDKNGAYVKIQLTKGTFEVNAVAFDKKTDEAQPKVDRATCSAWAALSGDVTVSDGTGAYAGVHGTVKITTSFAEIAPRYTTGAKKGQCNLNGNPVSTFSGDIEGAGHVSF